MSRRLDSGRYSSDMSTRTRYPPARAAATTPTTKSNRAGRARSGASAIIALRQSLGSDEHSPADDLLRLGHDHREPQVENGSNQRGLVQLHPHLLAPDSHQRGRRATA